MPADVGMLRKCSLLCDGDGDHEVVIWRDAAIVLNGTLKKLPDGPIVAHHPCHMSPCRANKQCHRNLMFANISTPLTQCSLCMNIQRYTCVRSLIS